MTICSKTWQSFEIISKLYTGTSMKKYLSHFFLLVLLAGCGVTAPVPVDDNSYSFSGKSSRQAYLCTARAAKDTGFVLDISQTPNQITGKLAAGDAMQDNTYTGTFLVDEKTKTVNARIEKHLANNMSLMFDNKGAIDVLLNKFQTSFDACIVK